jgi:signal transduction histidine kinase
VVQEALVNSFRHGKANRVDIQFRSDGRLLYVRVSDNGKGGPVDRHGIGQSGMAERIRKLGGQVRFSSYAHGYNVDASIPLTAQSP